MAKEIGDYWGNLESFLLSDDDARWKAIGWIILIVGCCGSVDLALLDSPVDDAVFLMGSLTLILWVSWIAWYCSFRRPRSIEPHSFSRRTLALQAASFIAFVLSLRLPHVEAAVVERKLIEATAGPPPYDKANELIRSAIHHNVSVSLKSIEVAKRQVARNLTAESVPRQEEDSANSTFAQLDAYAIYRMTGVKLSIPLPRVVVLSGIYAINETIDVNWGPLIGLDRARSGIRAVDFKKTKGSAIFSYEGQGERDAYVAHMTVSSTTSGNPVVPPPAFIHRDNSSSKLAVFDVTVSDLWQALDGIIWVDVAFDRCHIAYGGGPVLMKEVTFNDCEFASENNAASAVLEQIRLQSPKPITLTIP